MPFLDPTKVQSNEDLTNEIKFEDSLARDVEATKLAEQSLDALETWSPTFDDDD